MAQILIVDDEKMIAMLLRETLRRSGYEVVTASSGEEGLEMATQLRPELVISDVQMPGMNGFELIEQVNHLMPDTSCILMSGNAFGTPGSCSQELESVRVSAILRKPFQIGVLLTVVKEALESVAQQRNCVQEVSAGGAQQYA